MLFSEHTLLRWGWPYKFWNVASESGWRHDGIGEDCEEADTVQLTSNHCPLLGEQESFNTTPSPLAR